MRLFLDTETTGLNDDAEICELALIDEHENIIINTFIKPIAKIPKEAIRVHGITNELVQSSPTFDQIYPMLQSHLDGCDLYIYNARYDTRLINQSIARSAKTTYTRIKPAHIHCVMNAFSPVYGEWNDYHGNYRWQSLDTACRYFGITNPEAHRALGDAISACRVWKKLRDLGVMS